MKGKSKQKTSLTLQQVIDVADKAYPDGLVGLYHRAPYTCHGDTLAQFIAAELTDTFNTRAGRARQLAEAAHAIANAVRELNSVIRALENA